MGQDRTLKEGVAELRRLIKAKVPTVGVRNGRGTAYGWVEIWNSDYGAMYTDEQRAGLEELGLSPGGNFCGIGPESHDFWIAKLSGRPTETPNCMGCSRPSVEEVLCPCDMLHRVCFYHRELAQQRKIRLDCADVRRWREVDASKELVASVSVYHTEGGN